MDPFTVTTGCVGLLAAVAQLSVQISQFVSGVREARRDMDAVSRELTSLSLCLETLRDDSGKIQYPDGLRQNLIAVLKNCDSVTKDMAALLEKQSSGSLGRRIQWTAMGRDEMNKLRSSLETHKSALDIALDMTALLMISALKQDTEDIKVDTTAIRYDTAQIPNIKQDTSQIANLVQEIGFLRLQVTQLEAHDSRGGILIQRFLDESASCADTVADRLDEQDDFQSAEWISKDSGDILPLNTQLVVQSFTQADEACKETQGNTPAKTPNTGLEKTKPRNTELPNAEVVSTKPSDTKLISELPTKSSDTKLISELPTKPSDTKLISELPTKPSDTKLISELPSEPAVRTIRANTGPSVDSVTRLNHPMAPHDSDTVLLRKYPDMIAIKAASVARQKLSDRQRHILDEELKILVCGKKSLRQRLKGESTWIGDLVGGAAQVQYLLDKGASMSFGESYPETALHIELHHGNRTDVVGVLLSYGAILDKDFGAGTLHKICRCRATKEDIRIARALLAYGADPNYYIKVNREILSSLYFAVSHPIPEPATLLLRYGADANSVGRGGFEPEAHSPLGRACYRLYHQLVETLIWHGADPCKPRVRECDRLRYIPVQMVILGINAPSKRRKDWDTRSAVPILEILKKHGAADEGIEGYIKTIDSGAAPQIDFQGVEA